MDKFDDLPNIKENIESKLKKKPIIKSEKEALLKIDSLILCEDAIKKSIDSLSHSNKNLNETLKNKEKEISKNLENFIKKLEEDTNNRIKNIDKSELSEEEKKEEYIKCIEELDKISFLSDSLEKCIELSEENYLKFLEKPIMLNKDNLIEYLIDEEDNLVKNNVYDDLCKNKEKFKNLYNETNIPYLKNYICHSNMLIDECNKLTKLKVDENTDIGNAKEILISTNNFNEILQKKIEKIVLKNISKENLDYLFSQNMKLIRKNIQQSNKSVNIQKSPSIIENKLHKNMEENEDNYINIKYTYPYITCKNCDCSEFNFDEAFPELTRLKIVSSKLPFLFYKIADNYHFEKITELYLENCGIVDQSLTEIYYALLNNEAIRKNLLSLSFKNNKLHMVSIYRYIIEGDRHNYRFRNLKFIDFSNNDINFFNASLFMSVPKIQIIDFSNNNIQLLDKLNDFYSFIHEKEKKPKEKDDENKVKISQTFLSSQTINSDISLEATAESGFSSLLCLLAGNLVLNRDKQIEKYLKYLLKTLPKIYFPIKNINFTGLFYNQNYHSYLKEINLLKFNNSLVEIDLSLNNLTDDEISELFMNKFLLKKLKKINLSDNKLTDNLFKLLLENNSHEIYSNLKEINLSNNDIHFKKVKELKIFVKYFDCIQKLIIFDTPAEEYINNYIKKKIIRFNDEQNKKSMTEFNNEDLNIKELFEHNKLDKNKGIQSDDILDNQSNIKICMNNTVDFKFIEAARKLFAELFNKLDIKNVYSYS